MQSWSTQQDPRFLSTPDLQDQVIARGLDKLFDSDRASLLTQIVLRVIKEFDVDMSVVHNDSTTFKFHGAYAHQSPRAIQLKRGHSKDHRPDLKQMLYNLCISGDGALPFYFKSYDGNQADISTHWDTWKSVQGILDRSDFLYIADCKLYSSNNLDRIDKEGGRFITILPRNNKEVKDFQKEISSLEVRWSPLLKRKSPREQGKYDVIQIANGVYQTERGYRIYWYRSSEKSRRDSEFREEAVTKAINALNEINSSEMKRSKSQSIIQGRAEKILEKYRAKAWVNFEIGTQDSDEYKKIGKGRPGEESIYRKDSKKIYSVKATKNYENIEQSKLMDGIFPLITNTKLTPQEVYLHYKKQSLIEKRFSMAKSDFRVAPMFLKSNERIEAMATVYFLAQIIASIVERELRRQMSEKKIDSLPLLPEGRLTKTPTWEQVNRLFEYVSKSTLYQEDRELEVFKDRLTPEQEKVLELLKISPIEYF